MRHLSSLECSVIVPCEQMQSCDGRFRDIIFSAVASNEALIPSVADERDSVTEGMSYRVTEYGPNVRLLVVDLENSTLPCPPTSERSTVTPCGAFAARDVLHAYATSQHCGKPGHDKNQSVQPCYWACLLAVDSRGGGLTQTVHHALVAMQAALQHCASVI